MKLNKVVSFLSPSLVYSSQFFLAVPSGMLLSMYTSTQNQMAHSFYLKALKKKTTEILLMVLLFVNDTALVAHSETMVQSLANNLSRTCGIFSLTISVTKTVILGHKNDLLVNITLNGNNLTPVNKYRCLGSIVTVTLSLDGEIDVT